MLRSNELQHEQQPVIVRKKSQGFWANLFNKRKLEKSNAVAVIYLRKNGHADPMEIQTKNGFFWINGQVYHEDRDCQYLLGKEKLPFVIIPEWNTVPLGKKEWYDKDMQEKFHTLEEHVMKGIRYAERVRMGESDGKKLNPKALIGIGIVAIIGIAIFMGYK